MVISSLAFSFDVGSYRGMRIYPGNEKYDLAVKHYIKGLYTGIHNMVVLSDLDQKKFGTKSNITLFCVPRDLKVNVENLYAIIDDEIKRRNLPDGYELFGVLYVGLIYTFPCE